jgi:hypothetical protein
MGLSDIFGGEENQERNGLSDFFAIPMALLWV